MPEMGLLIGALLCLVIVAFALSAYALHCSIEARIEVRGLKNSTHQVQFVPLEEDLPGDKEDASLAKEMDKYEAKDWKSLTMDSDQPLS